MPHIPLFASQRFNGHISAGLYGDVIEELDYEIGRLLSVLDKLDISKNTLVIFTSDNGPWLSKGADGGHALPLRSGKGSVFEGFNACTLYNAMARNNSIKCYVFRYCFNIRYLPYNCKFSRY